MSKVLVLLEAHYSVIAKSNILLETLIATDNSNPKTQHHIKTTHDLIIKCNRRASDINLMSEVTLFLQWSLLAVCPAAEAET